MSHGFQPVARLRFLRPIQRTTPRGSDQALTELNEVCFRVREAATKAIVTRGKLRPPPAGIVRIHSVAPSNQNGRER